jgi:cytochrome c peroxidase
MDPFLKDSGRYQIEKLPENIFKFKTPSLRNVALTFPYMHDGRFKSLEQCLNHYTNQIGNLVNLDPLIPQAGILLSDSQKSDIISFLGTLTDTVFTKDIRFADPNFQ